MRFTFADAMTNPQYYVPLAQAAEDAGYHSFAVADSICYPEVSDSTYPYTPDGSREFLENKPFIEAFILITAMAQATERIRFVPFVLKLPVRPPVLVAKQAASIAALYDNRLSLGVGLSPWPEDFDVMGVPFPKRGKRMNEAMRIIRGLTSGGYFEHHGEIYDLQSIKINPVPSKPVPMLVGGHSDAALRRAVRLGDGWMHAGGETDELDEILTRLATVRKAEGKEGDPFEIHVASIDAFSVDGVKRLEDKGVTDVTVGFRMPYQMEQDTQPLEEKITALRKFSDKVISKCD
ncbi:TIGR03619 family F420-dependent LLM class oxidoreductase [Tomitella cavernea]|uniref:LLM class flavin-dependent oxidoreductase n=1 Tax=Tomitella cavernea TaxID=1387982 RepID=A0ABP9CZD8_9ACTN|nr:TIGR03619 family F420-dependent LLM class oxidoreductase [Tomitella cavernea]